MIAALLLEKYDQYLNDTYGKDSVLQSTQISSPILAKYALAALIIASKYNDTDNFQYKEFTANTHVYKQ